MLDEIATKLLQTSIDPNTYETTLTITGAGGFGKTTTVISLCHHPLIKEIFTDGFVFIELGPQTPDPSVKLRGIYNLLTDDQCDINVVEQKISHITSNYYHNLLVVIDDVWHVEDAEPLVKAFSNCKTILTTRMNDIEQYIPSKQSVIIGPMTQHEAITLLTKGIIDSSQLSQEDVSLLDELAQDVHLWPLLLSLIRGQLSHNLKQYHLSYHQAIQNVQAKLHHKGLTAFDKNNIEAINKSRKLAVKACIEVNLELLAKPSSDKLKSLILWTGIGASLETAVLNRLWNISKQEANDTVNAMWNYGLVQFTHNVVTNTYTQHCVEVHTVISHYIIECMDSNEVHTLSPLNNTELIYHELTVAFQLSCGQCDSPLATNIECLNYKLHEIENLVLPLHLKVINMYAILEPHHIILILQVTKDVITTSPNATHLLALLDKEIESLIGECKMLLNDVHKLCRKVNHGIQKHLCEKNYDKLIQSVEEYISNYPLFKIAEKAIATVKKLIPYYEGKTLQHTKMRYKYLQNLTCDYHPITTLLLPRLQLHVDLHKRITSSLVTGSHNIEQTYHYIESGKFMEECKLVMIKNLIKLKDIATK